MAKPSRSRAASKDARGLHGAMRLPGLEIEHYNLLVRDPDGEGFLGDRASQTAFRELVDTARRHHRTGKDPFGKMPTADIDKKAIDLVLVGGDADAAHLVHLAVEEYARRLVHVVQVFLAQPEWHGVERILLGGGFPDHATGGLAVRRALRLLQLARVDVKLDQVGHHADEAGLLGWVPLLPAAARRADAFLAVDVGGTNIRCGIVEHRLGKADDGSRARVLERLKWRHADDAPDRAEAVRRMAAMLNGLAAQARTLGLSLAPFVGIACPGRIEVDGGISQGAQNLPGDWERPFHLPDALGALLDDIGGKAPRVVLHNDAVVQALSERQRMRKASRWAVLTIGTGLGNASFSNR
ncbi:ROK family protein [Pseudoxanthomonas sp. 10H]|uniref:ROK family protein n=1 Tax=Pseudoxanthomonas sp. 10H TaxID=3242729 RepID=UPI003555DE43